MSIIRECAHLAWGLLVRCLSAFRRPDGEPIMHTYSRRNLLKSGAAFADSVAANAAPDFKRLRREYVCMMGSPSGRRKADKQRTSKPHAKCAHSRIIDIFQCIDRR